MSQPGTVPAATDQDVVDLLENNGLKGMPVLLSYQDVGYAEAQCHISAKHHALLHGGTRVHGWALWRFDTESGVPIIFAEHHSVWEDPSGQLVDVTPPRFGAPAVLFVRDDTATISQEGGVFLLRTDLTSWPEIPRVFRGAATEYEFFPLDPANLPTAVANYVTSLNFDMSRYVTEPGIG